MKDTKKIKKKKTKKIYIIITAVSLFAFILFCGLMFAFTPKSGPKDNDDKFIEPSIMDVVNFVKANLSSTNRLIVSPRYLELARNDNKPIFMVFYNPEGFPQNVTMCDDCDDYCNKIVTADKKVQKDSVYLYSFLSNFSMRANEIKGVRLEAETANGTKGDYVTRICLKYSDKIVESSELKIKVQ